MFNRLAMAFAILAWRVVDTHIHILGMFSDDEAAELMRRLRLMLARLHPDVPLHLSRRVPVQNQWHLGEVFTYILRQDEHHGVGGDPYHEGSVLPDLLGLRVLGAPIVKRVIAHLPRVRRSALLPHLLVPSLEEGVALEHLKESACSAFAWLDLEGRGEVQVAARAAAAVATAKLSAEDVGEALGTSARTIRRLRLGGTPASHVRAVRLQMALRLARPRTDGLE